MISYDDKGAGHGDAGEEDARNAPEMFVVTWKWKTSEAGKMFFSRRKSGFEAYHLRSNLCIFRDAQASVSTVHRRDEADRFPMDWL